MELRVLHYFLAVAREQSISRAAESLHLSQPTLSVQLRHLEEELGKQLILRGTPGSKKIALTDEGVLLRKRAEEILQLVKKTEDEITQSDEMAGNIIIGAGESDSVRYLAKVGNRLRGQYPLLHFHIQSGDKTIILEALDRGLVDFGLVFGAFDSAKYQAIEIPVKESWGVLMRRDSPLAAKAAIAPEDLWDKPLIISRQKSSLAQLVSWMKREETQIDVVGTYSLLYNASLMVEEGMGYALCFDKIINVSGDSQLCFRPLSPTLESGANLIWKRYQVFSKASETFLQTLRALLQP